MWAAGAGPSAPPCGSGTTAEAGGRGMCRSAAAGPVHENAGGRAGAPRVKNPPKNSATVRASQQVAAAGSSFGTWQCRRHRAAAAQGPKNSARQPCGGGGVRTAQAGRKGRCARRRTDCRPLSPPACAGASWRRGGRGSDTTAGDSRPGVVHGDQGVSLRPALIARPPRVPPAACHRRARLAPLGLDARLRLALRPRRWTATGGAAPIRAQGWRQQRQRRGGGSWRRPTGLTQRREAAAAAADSACMPGAPPAARPQRIAAEQAT